MVWLSSSGEEKKIWKVKDATDDDNEKRTYIFWSKKLTGDFDSNELKRLPGYYPLGHEIVSCEIR